MKRHAATSARLLIVGVLLLLLGLPTASAEPADDGGISVAPILPLAQLGAPANLAFYGVQGVETISIPVPPGLDPVALNAFAQLPVNVRSATITVMQENRALARIEVPPGESAPIVIPLAGAAVVDNSVQLTLRTYLLPIDGYCLDPSNPLRLIDGAVSFAGAERVPTAVADFLPPVLRQLTIFVDEQPSQAESDAAVRLATSVTAHYGAQNPDIVLAPLAGERPAPDSASGPLQRHIVIREDEATGVSLLPSDGVPGLLIAGPAGELANQTRLITSDLDRLALASKAVVGPLRSTPQLPGDDTTLRKLGQPGVNATALSPQVSIGLDQTRLGRSVHQIRVHLRGSYTPLPAAIGGQLIASIGGETIDRWTADPSGTIDRWVDVPDDLVQRYTSLGVRLDISGDTGRCGEFQPLTLTIDGDSPVQTRAAQPPIPAGFQSLPQSLLPRAVVGVEPGFDSTRRAVAILVGLQRLSALPIDAELMSLTDAAADAAPAVLIRREGWTDERITLPVRPGPDGEITVAGVDGTGEPTSLTLDPALRFGSIQVVHQGNRTVLVATSNNAPEELDALLSWLGQDVQRWSRLDGSALVAVPGRDPVLVAGAQPAPPAPDDGRGGSPQLLGIGAAVAALLAGVVTLLIYRRAKRSRATS